MNDHITSTTLDPVISRYLAHRRALGRQYDMQQRTLRSLTDFLVRAGESDLSSGLFESWCRIFESLTANVRRARQVAVRNFCLYRQRTEPRCFVPDINRFARPQPHAAPIILTPAQIGRLLELAGTREATPTSPLRPYVLRLALVLLYTAGLRRRELLRLTLADVDAHAAVLRVQESKFHKSRWVPLSCGARRELRRYLVRRLAAPLDTTPSSPLLCNLHHGLRGYTGTGLRRGITELLHEASIRGVDGRVPRIQDFRHSFAIESLMRWYRQGEDVQSNLPKLALYMGHVSIVSTAYYLRWIPELQELASNRFAKRGARSAPIQYLEPDEVEALLKAVDRGTAAGRRDYALLSLMFNIGARVQEVLDLRLCDLRVQRPCQVRLQGKGNKVRVCPIWPQTARLLQRLVEERPYPVDANAALFVNNRGEKLTRFGVGYLLRKHLVAAEAVVPSLREKRIHPHSLRHTTAVSMLKSGVDFPTISQWLGHASLDTTMRYSKADIDMKRQALLQVFPDILTTAPTDRRTFERLPIINWLKRL